MSAGPIGSEFEIRATPDWLGVYRLNSDELMWCLRWREITRIAVWKEDLFTVDLVRMGFSWAGSVEMKCADEEMSGWDQLQSALAIPFHLDQSDWWDQVVRPPFAENFTVLWRQASSCPESECSG